MGFAAILGMFALMGVSHTLASAAAVVLFLVSPAVFLVWRLSHGHEEPAQGCMRCRWRAGRERQQHWRRYRMLLAQEQARVNEQRMQRQREAMQLQVEQHRAWDAANYQRLLRERDGG